MKTRFLFVFLVASLSFGLHAQGLFIFFNLGAETRLISLDGPYAGLDYLGQMLAGPTASSLLPVGEPKPHGLHGLIIDGEVAVPDMPMGTYAAVQMVAWKGVVWGTSLAAVPPEQLGRTDVTSVFLGGYPFPTEAPRFRQPAIVPPVPEPSAVPLGLAGFGLGMLFRRTRFLRAVSTRAAPSNRGQSP